MTTCLIRCKSGHIMAKLGVTVSRSALLSILVFGMTTAVALAGDLSRYRNFRLGADLPAIAKQTDTSPSQATVVDSRPVLIQELAWRPQPLGSSARTDSVRDVVFGFYGSKLFRITVNYDRYQTEGLTADDFVQALSATYGIAAKPSGPSRTAEGLYGDQEEVLARWEDASYRLDLIRSSYGPSFKLIAVLKSMEGDARTATLEAKRLDDQEAPQRDAARIAAEEQTTRAKLEKARLANKPNFRP